MQQLPTKIKTIYNIKLTRVNIPNNFNNINKAEKK